MEFLRRCGWWLVPWLLLLAAGARAQEAAAQDWQEGRTVSASAPEPASGLVGELKAQNPVLVVPRAILFLPRVVLRYALLLPLQKLAYFVGGLQSNPKFQIVLLSFYRVGFRPSAGLRLTRFVDEDYRTSVSGTATYGGRRFNAFQLELRHRLAEEDRLKLYASYRQQGDKRFYGIGDDLEKDDLTRYFLEEVEAGADLRKTWMPRFSTELLAIFKRVRTADSQDIDEDDATLSDNFSLAEAPGFGEAQSFLLTSATATLDFRRDKTEHELGLLLQSHLDGYWSVSGGSYSTLLYGGSVTGIVPVFRDRVIAGRLLAEGASEVGDAIPFYLLPALGRGGVLRGLPSGRFRDRFMTVASLEYRWPLAAQGDGVIFVDSGQVFRNAGSFDLRNWNWGFGAGLRYNTRRGVLLSLQVAFSSETTELLLLTGDDLF